MPPFSHPRIYLASRSPRRRELLHQIGVEFDTLTFRAPPRDDADVSEAVLPGEDAETYVQRVACAKADGALRRLGWRSLRPQPVLSADTTLDLDGEIIGKPDDETHAVAILRQLSGRSHRVLTAVAVADASRMEHSLSVSTVHFRPLDDEDIRRYIASGEPFDKAGAYGIQGRAASFIREISGSYTGIMGLPLFETSELLRKFGLEV
ncbi:Maf family protein [Uliginosibacterium aquaticum]|uniref:dTTP/UTP pyrophosphatase n=1 Tax=Uliginosibacterium aquaticum TaxID=2731212 RepID=A0ABX2IHQ8_9RHOO|nr:Maf family protein [Uliginosibacterium aquaticum]NSL53625.1 septum formation inhibitor Maf [Uliginosibacterium aquaticum]